MEPFFFLLMLDLILSHSMTKSQSWGKFHD